MRSVAVRFYDRAAMRRLYRANPERAALWLFMAHTGLRRGELVGLGKESVAGRRLKVESDPDEDGQGRTKSGKWREVPLNRRHMTMPDGLSGKRPQEKPPLFFGVRRVTARVKGSPA